MTPSSPARIPLPAGPRVAASTLRLPPGDWRTVLDCLCAHFPSIDREQWSSRMRRGLVTDDLMSKAVARLGHRGPDGQRHWIEPGGRIGLGHARLAVIDLDTGASEQVEIAIKDAQGYQTLVGVTAPTGEVYVDRTRSGPSFHEGFPDRHIAPVDLKGRKVKLRLFVDESIIELYVNDGARTITDRFFRGGGALSWSISARGGEATIEKLDAWTLSNPLTK